MYSIVKGTEHLNFRKIKIIPLFLIIADYML